MGEATAREDAAILARLVRFPIEEQLRIVGSLTHPQARELFERWPMWAHPGQAEPRGEPLVWLILAGRGFGKTRAGAEWLAEMARRNRRGRFALVGATTEDARRVMIEGASGLIATARTGEPVKWKPGLGELEFASGAVAQLFSAASPEHLRGPEHDAAWCDELGAWAPATADAAWDNLMLGMRRGPRPRVLVTTTPRATPLMHRVERLAAAADAVTRGRTEDNPHLPASFVEAMLDAYGGTRLGRQELDGELLDDVEGALWTRTMLENCRVKKLPELVRVVVAVDPPASVGGDACGIVAAGLGRDGLGYVLEDASVAGASPERWARAVAGCAARRRADMVVAEKNQGGDMVRLVLTAADAGLPLRLVSATRGKVARAEPVALLYEAGKVRHAGAFPALEDELCGLQLGGGYQGPGRSPDRADALVWALHALMLRRRRRAGVTGL